ncbi:MAG: LssY C-terminal domain-containing protein [Candidatus Acidiferrales bacterium]
MASRERLGQLIRAARLAPPFYALFLLLPYGLFGQGLPDTPANIVMDSGTPVKLQLAQTISSAHAHKGDLLDFVVVNDVEVEGLTVIRAGALAEGSVIGVKGKRTLGMGGHVIIKLDWVQLSGGERVGLVARKEFKGRSHTIRMAVGMAITGLIYLPAAPALLLSPGRDRTVLKGTEITAYTKRDAWIDVGDLPAPPETDSELSEMVKQLPPRALNGEGREGDMLNLIFVAKEDDLQEAFAHAGWLKVEKSKPEIIWHLLWQRNHYERLPMDRLYVFGRAQDYSYALPDPKSIVARRHHLRIWKTDFMVDGTPLWVGAATQDVSIHLVKHRLHLLHRIDPDVDAERDFIAGNLAETQQLDREEYVRCAQPVFSAQTATGQAYYSDSRMLLLELNQGASSTAGATEIAGKSK